MKVFFSALFVLNLLGQCLGSGYLDVQAVAFENPYGKASNGENCDLWPDNCDHKFSFCLLSGGSCKPTFLTGTYWDQFYVDFGNPMEGGIANPMRFHFQDEYPGQFYIRTVVVDDDHKSTPDDPVDTITVTNLTVSPGGDTVKVKQPGSRSSYTTYLTLRFTLRCDTDYHGERCNVYCRATNSESGHYNCVSSGEKVCLEGWTNPTQHCLTAVCRVGCEHGRCDRPGECICTEGYGGSLCNEPICKGGCGRGTCTSPGVCSCQEGSRGKSCDKVICKEGCKYGRCTNPGECHCTPGYSGDLCDQPVCEGGCGHGTCNRPGVCSCEGGYTGRNCEQGPDTVDGTSRSKNCSGPPCTCVFCGENGTCTNVVCECPPGSTGQLCEGPPPNRDGSHTKCLLLFAVAIVLAIAVVGLVCLLLWKKAVPTWEYRAITKKLIRKFFTKGSSRAKDTDKCPLVEDGEEYGSEEDLSEDDKQCLMNLEDSKV